MLKSILVTLVLLTVATRAHANSQSVQVITQQVADVLDANGNIVDRSR
jgi:hypothetical protein